MNKGNRILGKRLLFCCLASGLTACQNLPQIGGMKLGGGSTEATGAASGEASANASSKLETCTSTLGTLGIDEDQSTDWYRYYSANYGQLGSTTPLLRLIVQQSNCFVIVERGKSFNNMMRERDLAASGEIREQGRVQKGEMVGADYTMSPTINFSAKNTGGMGGAVAGVLGSVAGGLVAGMKSNEASTTLLLIDNRSGVQLSASEGSAKNFDFAGFGGGFAGIFAGAGGYSNTPQGKVITAAFMDSYNNMVRSLRGYKAQTVDGGLGTGGRIGVQGGSTPASRTLQ
ncbi:MAG: CsgG/HfaB family protein [Panacagrimonas sp.]